MEVYGLGLIPCVRVLMSHHFTPFMPMTSSIPQTRKEALATGSRVYRAYLPCTRNSSHEPIRLTRSGRCEECNIGEKILAKLARDELREKALEWARKEVQREQAKAAQKAAREAEKAERRKEALRLKRQQKNNPASGQALKPLEAPTASQQGKRAPSPSPAAREAPPALSKALRAVPPWEALEDCGGSTAPDDSPPW